MDVIGVIPARYSSTRLEGKVLVDILGKSMLQRVWERAKESRLLDDLIIACDDQRVAEAASEFGAKTVFTSRGHVSGTDRITEVVNPLEVKIIINIQADEPLIHPTMIDNLAGALLEDSSLYMATIMKKIENPAAAFINDPNLVKVAVDKNNFALYFSRAAIPCYPLNSQVSPPVYYKHVGLYAYSKDFLFTFKNLAVSHLEKCERLEQLRVLEEGYRIKVIETKYDTISVDTPQDLEKVKQYIKQHQDNAQS